MTDELSNRRILVIDDNAAIHRDFRKILEARDDSSDTLSQMGTALFGEPPSPAQIRGFEINSALQGQEGLDMIQQAVREGRPYAAAFVDVRMPPGWDGIATTFEILRTDADVQLVICSAYSDYSWDQMVAKLGFTDRLLFLKKPFEPIEVRQLAYALTKKWMLLRERREYLADLERIVGERTFQLKTANERLQIEMADRLRAEKRLRHVQRLESLGQLTASIAHEINNPLSFIIGNLDFLRQQLEQLEQRIPGDLVHKYLEALTDARDGASRIKRIVHDVKLFARGDEGKPTAIDLLPAIEYSVKMMENQIRHRAELVLDLATVPPVLGGPLPLQQVLVNLLLNAVEALPPGKVHDQRIRISTRTEAEQFVVVEVLDTGQGIPAEHLERVFEPFFTTKAVGDGLGLGLAMCHGIVTAWGGKISIDSRVGHGTIVSVWLPVAGATAPELSTEASVRPPDDPGAGQQPESAVILVIDDEPPLLRMFQRILKGWQVQVCTSVQEGLALVERQQYDMVFCDLMMPGLSGMDFYHELMQKLPELADRVVFVTGGAFTEEAKQFLATVSNSVVGKPFDRAEILELVRERTSQLTEPGS